MKRKYIDEHVFDEFSNPESAYWIGFILADGCILNLNDKPMLSVALSVRDKEHLQKLKTFLKSEHKIQCTTNTCRLRVYAPILCQTLSKYGIDSRKSTRESVPESLKHNRNFWRGVVDGDGWVTYYKNGWGEIGICGSKSVCAGFLSYVQTIGFTNATVRKHKEANCYKICVRGYTGSEIICHLYEDSTIYLNRKKIQFELTRVAYKQRGRRKGKLTNDEIEDIRERNNLHQSTRSIAALYDVSWNTVDRILKQQTYKYTNSINPNMSTHQI